MEAIAQIIVAAFAGTTLMTLFSYLLAYTFDKQFKEPVLLNKLIGRSHYTAQKLGFPATGWILHYGMGIIFVVIYYLIWQLTPLSTTILSGCILGFFSGLGAVAGWALMFRLHSDPPVIDLKGYYIQLVFAHVIFGAGAAVAYRLAG